MAYWNGGGAVIDRAGRNDWTAEPAAPSIVPGLPHDRRAAVPPRLSRARPRLPRCPEIDCVRHLLAPGVLALAELRAAETDVGADRVLIAGGAISEETYVAALAASLDTVFEPLNDRPRQDCPLSDDQLLEAAATGLLPLSDGDNVNFVVAPRLVDSRRLLAVVASAPEFAQRIRFTSTARLQDYVMRHGAQAIERRAVDDLRVNCPEFSADSVHPRLRAIAVPLGIAALAAIAAPGMALAALQVALGVMFLSWTGLRLLGLLSERLIRRRPRTFTDDWLPTYTIIIALYREAAAVTDLAAALRRLNYPGIRAQTPQAC